MKYTSHVLTILTENGFNPVAVTTMICEETFVFKTIEECEAACRFINPDRSEDGKSGVTYGYWYSLTGGSYTFDETLEYYNKKFGYTPEIHWL